MRALLILISVLVCFANFISLALFTCGVTKLREFARSLRPKDIGFTIAMALLAAILINLVGGFIVVFLFIEYLVILYISHRKGQRLFNRALRGVIGIGLMLLAELAIFFLLYLYMGDSFSYWMYRANYRVIVVGYLAMAICLYVLIVVRNILRMEKYTHRIGICLLVIKTTGDALLLYLATTSVAYGEKYVLLLIVLFLSYILDYPMVFILMPRMEDSLRSISQQEKGYSGNDRVNRYEYYLNMEEEHRQIRKMYHEIKNQLMIMEEQQKRWESETGDRQAENSGFPEKQMDARATLAEIEKLRRSYHTGQPALDAIFFETRKQAEERDIAFEAVVGEGCLNFMEEEDVVLIFRNALLNAIEACSHMEKGPKWIQVKAGVNEQTTMVYIKNTTVCDRQKGSLQTIKEDKVFHGIGLTTIRECAEKYGGYMSVIEKDATFQLAILFNRG